jgi:hypothetical protein
MALLIEHTRQNSAVPQGLQAAASRRCAALHEGAGKVVADTIRGAKVCQRAPAPGGPPVIDHDDLPQITRLDQNPTVWRRPDKELAFPNRLRHIAARDTILLLADLR